ncbi:MAG: substrate-binding domain-containing protein [Planctomycetota bacterium]|jgi:ribose transport system substrate-binding protein|nr:substrate-binding domain-containing protein [Planctomycetota bacterium]
MKKTTALLLATLVAALVGLAPVLSAAQYHIEVVSKGFQHDFWKQVNLGCVAAGKDLDASVNFVGPASESNISEQIEQLSNAINKRPDAICFAALDREASLDLIFQAGAGKIPVVTFDSDVGGDTGGAVRAFVATDNQDAGAAAAKQMYEAVKGKVASATSAAPVHIGVLSQDTTSQSVGDRTVGFIKQIVELCGAATTSVEGHVKFEKVIASAKVVIDVGIPAETIDAAANTIAQTLFNKPNLLGIYGSNEFAAKAIVNVNETLNILGPGKTVGIGFDSGSVQVQAVKDKTLYGAITQNPFQIGYLSVKTAIQAIKGEKVSNIAVPFFFYTAENMNQPEISSCLYE